MVMTSQETSSIRFLAKLLAACDTAGDIDPDYAHIRASFIPGGEGRSVTVKLVAPSGDHFLVTVEWLSEESP